MSVKLSRTGLRYYLHGLFRYASMAYVVPNQWLDAVQVLGKNNFWRIVMRTLAKISLLGGMALAMGYTVAFADEPPINDKPLTEKWFPTEFGADDKAGAINRVTPDKVMKALKLVKTG